MRYNSVVVAALALAGSIGLVQTAQADSISTGVADWKLVSIDSFYNDANPGSPISVPGAGNVGSSAPVIAPNGAWGATSAIASDDADAKWIGATTNGANEGVWGWYTFELTLNALTPGVYTIEGSYSADNMVDSFQINGVEMVTGLPVASPSAIYGFNFTYDFATVANAPITITARVYNESVVSPFQGYPAGPTAVDAVNNPLGFILAGEVDRSFAPATAAPLPASALGGVVMLAGLGVSRIRRRMGEGR